MVDDPAVEARLAEIEAAREREQTEVLVEEIEVRTGVVYDDDPRVNVLLRVPFRDQWEMPARKDALRAETRVAVARMEEVVLERRAEICLPSLDQLVRDEHLTIYSAFIERQAGLQAWNRELMEAGLVDELRYTSFELESQTKLRSRRPADVITPEMVIPVLPSVAAHASPLEGEPEVLRTLVQQHNPSVSLHEAMEERYEALARRERMARWPSLKFVDFAVQPLPSPGDPISYGGRVAFEVPIGPRLRAQERRYSARARGQSSERRKVVDDRVQASREALAVIQDFERRADEWQHLLDLAGSAEEVADRWWKQRLVTPRRVAALLDEVYRARIEALRARERAGVAGCTLLATTGVSVDEWPRVQ
ncbi:MAG: hypothetical protein JRG80_15035 [Deltaproteobacteria bacterium]|nr:hypothetical protein [Deltaproteobacteria bacterium]MBW2400574.1 hypothetical protein [Deltaproteobacteria bacterium]